MYGCIVTSYPVFADILDLLYNLFLAVRVGGEAVHDEAESARHRIVSGKNEYRCVRRNLVRSQTYKCSTLIRTLVDEEHFSRV